MMPKSSTLWVFLLVLAAAMVGYSLWPTSMRSSLQVVEHSEIEPEADPKQVKPVVEASSQESEAERSEIDPLETEQVRRVLVLDPDGNPVAGELLYFRLDDAEIAELSSFIAKLEGDPNVKPEHATRRANAVRTNQDGIAELPVEGVGTIGMRTALWQGARVFGLFRPSDPDPIVLQLAPFQCIEVQVVTASGEPAAGVSVCLARSTAAGRAREAAHAESPERERRQAEPAIMSVVPDRDTDSDGIARFDAAFEQGHIDYHQLNDDETFLYAQADLPLASSVRKRISYGESTQVQLVLPPLGGVRIERVNYPALIVPKLLPIDTSTPFLSAPKAELQSDSKGIRVYEIPRAGLGVQMRVALNRELTDGSRSSSRSTDYPGLVFAGPVVAGEWVDVRLEFDRSASLVGTLVNSLGEPIASDFDDPSEISLFGSTGDPAIGPFEIPVEVDREGVMVASLPVHSSSQLSWEDFTELCLLRLPSNHGFYTEGMELPQAEWALLPIPLPKQAGPIDLGTIQVGSENPPLVVQVVDQLTGEAIPQAQLVFERAYLESGSEASEWETARISRLMQIFSSESGVFNLPGSRTSSLLAGFSISRDSIPGLCRVKVAHKNYVAAQLEFSIEDTQITVALQKAYSLTGQVRASPGVDRVQLRMIPAGSELSAQTGNTGRATVFLANRGLQEDGSSLVDFEIKTLEAGLQDLVVLLRGENEIMRVNGIDPSVTGSLEQVIDLRGLVQFARIALIDKDGNQLKSKHAGASLIALSGRMSTGGPAPWEGDWVVVPLAPSTRFIGVIKVPGYRSVTLDDIGPGDHRVQLGGMREARMRYVPGRELPEGSSIQANWIPIRTPDRTITLEVQGEEDQRISVGAAPTFRVRWRLLDADGKRIGRFTSDVTLTEAMLETGEIIDIPVPEELFRE